MANYSFEPACLNSNAGSALTIHVTSGSAFQAVTWDMRAPTSWVTVKIK